MNEKSLLSRITVNPEIFGGKPIIRGHRLAVEHILGMLADGDDPDTILQNYPWLEKEDIQACLILARKLTDREHSVNAISVLINGIHKNAFEFNQDSADNDNSVWQENRAFFRDHEQEFEKNYPGKFVAVHDGNVLKTGNDLGALAGEIYAEFGDIPFYAEIPGYSEIEMINLPRNY